MIKIHTASTPTRLPAISVLAGSLALMISLVSVPVNSEHMVIPARIHITAYIFPPNVRVTLSPNPTVVIEMKLHQKPSKMPSYIETRFEISMRLC